MTEKIKITQGVIIDINEEDYFIIKGAEIVEKHFTNEHGDMDLSASDLYIEDIEGKIVRLYGDYEEIQFEYLT